MSAIVDLLPKQLADLNLSNNYYLFSLDLSSKVVLSFAFICTSFAALMQHLCCHCPLRLRGLTTDPLGYSALTLEIHLFWATAPTLLRVVPGGRGSSSSSHPLSPPWSSRLSQAVYSLFYFLPFFGGFGFALTPFGPFVAASPPAKEAVASDGYWFRKVRIYFPGHGAQVWLSSLWARFGFVDLGSMPYSPVVGPLGPCW